MSRPYTFEERVILAAQFGRQIAINYLLIRWEQPKNKLVTALARSYGLSEQDAADARQEAVLWLLNALNKYRFEGPLRRREYRLKAFLRVTLQRRMSNYARAVRRNLRFAKACRDVNGPSGRAIANRAICHGRSIDPAILCANEELHLTSQQRVAQLGGPCERLYEMLQAGASMYRAAEDLQISYHHVRKLRVQIENAVRQPSRENLRVAQLFCEALVIETSAANWS